MTDIKQVYIKVGKQLGLSEQESLYPGINNVSQEDSIKLGDYVFAYVYQHPEEFTAAQGAIAERHYKAWGTDTPLQDTSFDWGMLSSEIGNNVVNAAEDVASIGKGVLNLASMGKWLIPTIGLIVAGIVVYKFYNASDIIPKLRK